MINLARQQVQDELKEVVLYGIVVFGSPWYSTFRILRLHGFEGP